MDICKAVCNLNNCAKTLYKDKIARGDGFYFYSGNSAEKLKEIILSVAPRGKIVSLFGKNSFSEKGTEFTSAVNAAGAKAYNVVVDDSYDFVKAAGDVLRAPEDVRLIVAADNHVLSLAQYCAKLAGVPLVCFVRDFNLDGILSPHIFIANGNATDCIKTEIRRHVVIDSDAIAARRAELALSYLDTESKIPALADYRICCVLKGERADKDAYAVARQAIIDVFGIFAHKKEEMPTLLIYNGLLSELANAAAHGKLFDFSALNQAELLLGGKNSISPDLKLRLFSGISGVYYALFCGDYEKLLCFPDYISRAEKIAEMTGTDAGQYLEGLKKQAVVFDRKKDAVAMLKERLKGEIVSQNLAASKISAAFYALSGADAATPNLPFEKYAAATGNSGLFNKSDANSLNKSAENSEKFRETDGEKESNKKIAKYKNSNVDIGKSGIVAASKDISDKRFSNEKRNADYKNIALAIKHCGDLPFGINGMSVARESGVTEYL